MSSKETWAKLGGEGDIPKTAPGQPYKPFSAIDTRQPEHNMPPGTPFERTTPGVLPTSYVNPTSPKFAMGDVVLHLATGALYGILDVPPLVCIERTGEAAYQYRRIDGADPRKWIRCQQEMEDGRFTLHRQARR